MPATTASPTSRERRSRSRPRGPALVGEASNSPRLAPSSGPSTAPSSGPPTGRAGSKPTNPTTKPRPEPM